MSVRIVGPALGLVLASLASCVSPGPVEGEMISSSEAAVDTDLRALSRVTALYEVCPESRQDALCVALRTAERATAPADAESAYSAAAAAVAARVAIEPRETVVTDPALRYYVRDRAQALLVWNALFADQKSDARPEGFASTVDAFLALHYPLYAPSAFPMAHAWLRPVAGSACDKPRELLLIFPGVLRSNTRVEFDTQAAAIAAALPCLRPVRMETDTFVPAATSAQKAATTLAALDGELGALPVHILGYSQGVTNALEMLATHPDIAARTRSFVSLNSAAHGSETIDTILAAAGLADNPNARCDQLPRVARPACEAAARTSLRPVAAFVRQALLELGFSADDVADQSLGQFIEQRRGGFDSLSTKGTAAFWQSRGPKLPTGVLYLSFRSVITDVRANLPASNAFSYDILTLTNPQSPYNDMQMRLERHPLGGPLASREAISHVIEGNHWQWELSAADLSETAIPAAMLDRIPRAAMWTAYYQALHEAGIVLP